jgi:hypothetical protein
MAERRTIPLVDHGAGEPLCPLAPPAQASVQARALHRACLILGGIEPLARHLKSSQAELRAWLTGAAAVPMEVFCAAVEIVLLHASGSGRPS